MTPAPPGSPQFVSVGVLYNSGAFMFVAQQQVVPSIITRTFTTTAEVKTVPTSLDRGGHGLLETEIIITRPVTNLTISAFNPLGYDDTFHLGSPVREMGEAFVSPCNTETGWQLTARQSISRKSVGKIDLTYRGLMNLDSSRDETSGDNKINIKIPITATSQARPGQYAFTIGNPGCLVFNITDVGLFSLLLFLKNVV